MKEALSTAIKSRLEGKNVSEKAKNLAKITDGEIKFRTAFSLIQGNASINNYSKAIKALGLKITIK